jgi:integrase
MIVKRRNAAGKLRYMARVYQDGKRVSLGTFALQSEAKQAIKDFDPKPSGVTCGEFARMWLAQGCPRTSGRQLKAETIREYDYRLRAFLKEFEDDGLSIPRDRAFRWALKHKHDVPFVAALLSHALDLGLIATNPFASLGISRGRGRKDKAPPSEQELEQLCEACFKVKGTEWKPYAAQFAAFIRFQAYTGLRPGESFELRWSDIDGDRITVGRRLGKYGTVDVPKSGVVRTVLLPPPASEALASFPRSLDLVFRGVRGQRLTRSACFRYFDRVRDEARLPDVDVYDLRHYAGHHMYVAMGLPARVVATQLGHNDGGRLVETLYGHGGVGALDELEEAWGMGRKSATSLPQSQSSAG